MASSESDGETQAIVAAALLKIPLFNGCDADEIQAAAKLLRPGTRAAGDAFETADLISQTYLVVSGQAVATDENGTVTHLAAGDVFGLLRFAVAEAPTSSVTALTTLRILEADEEGTARLLRLDGVAHALVRGAVARRRTSTGRRYP